MTERKYLPTLAELIDRMTIVQLKAIFIPEHRDDYVSERKLIEHDIDLLLANLPQPLTARELHAVAVIMLVNHAIWLNESKAREGGTDQDHLLKFTHSINGCRNTAKNVIAAATGGRKDFKIDAFAADLLPEFKYWDIFNA
jgi:hypothetical protein